MQAHVHLLVLGVVTGGVAVTHQLGVDTLPGPGALEVGGVGAGKAVFPRQLTRAPAVVGVIVLCSHPRVVEPGILAVAVCVVVGSHNRTEDRFPDIQVMSRVWTRSTNVMYLVRLVCTLDSEVLSL